MIELIKATNQSVKDMIHREFPDFTDRKVDFCIFGSYLLYILASVGLVSIVKKTFKLIIKK